VRWYRDASWCERQSSAFKLTLEKVLFEILGILILDIFEK